MQVFILAFFLTLFAHSSSSADIQSPGSVNERLQQNRDILDRQKRLERELQQPENTAPAVIDKSQAEDKAKVKKSNKSFYLNKINISASKILSDEELNSIIEEFLDREVYLQDLHEILDRLNKLYKEKGYIAKAVLPPQKISDGEVTIKLIEGYVGKVLIENNNSTKNEYITRRLPVTPKDLVSIDRLEKALFKFNTINDININTVLKPGEESGSTDYLMHVSEPSRHFSMLSFDNFGTHDIGKNRIGISYLNRSLFGYRDAFSLGGNLARGTRSFYGAYHFYLGGGGTNLSLSTSYSEIDIIKGPLEPLDISGDSYNIEMEVTQPFIVAENISLNAFAAIQAKRSTTDFADVTLFETNVRKINMGFDVQSISNKANWYGRVMLGTSRETFNSDKNFVKLNVDYSYSRLVFDDWLFTFRARGQVSDKNLLPSSEQFQIGGTSTVRGYREGLLIGDDGYNISSELSIPFPGIESLPAYKQTRLLLFLDHGGAFPFKGNNQSINSDDFLTSIGAGLDIRAFGKTSAFLTVGIPLDNRLDGQDDIQAHFSLQTSFY